MLPELKLFRKPKNMKNPASTNTRLMKARRRPDDTRQLREMGGLWEDGPKETVADASEKRATPPAKLVFLAQISDDQPEFEQRFIQSAHYLPP